MRFCLGRLPYAQATKVAKAKTLFLSDYVTAKLPTPADKVYREYKIPKEGYKMYANDKVGDCTLAGGANLKILFTSHTGKVVIPTTDVVLDMYAEITGYNRKTGDNDNGAAMPDVLNYFQTKDFFGTKILGWAAINYRNINHRRIGVDLFGATYVGIKLPNSAQSQFKLDGQCNFEVVQNDSIEGLHCIVHPGYGSEGGDYWTWSNPLVKASADWEETYVEEEYVVIAPDWFDQTTGLTPGLINRDLLWNDLKLISNA